MSDATYTLTPLFTLKTKALVGREAEIARLQQARFQLADANCPTLLFYIAGRGGMGKTRFLEWVRDTAPEHAELVTDIIDFYDTAVHTDMTLMERIVESIIRRAPDDAQHQFDQFLDDMRLYRTQQSAGIGELENIRRQIKDEFVAAWNEVTRSRPAIILLDTAELLQFQSDEIQKQLQLPLPTVYAKTWLTDMVEQNALKRTLFVVAGRPEPVELSQDLRRLASHENRQITLEGLDEQGVAAYFASLAETLQAQGDTDHAESICALDDDAHNDLRHLFYGLTSGRPVALAVLTQLYLSGQWGELGPLIGQTSQSAANMDVQQAQQSLQKTLVNALMHYTFGEVGEPMQYLALLRKGMTAERLQRVWGEGNGLEYCQQIIDHLQQQTFVKARPDGSIVLHDEVADWIENELYADDPGMEKARRIYANALAQYDKEIESLEGKTDQYTRQTEALIAVQELQDAHLEALTEQGALVLSSEQTELDQGQVGARQQRVRLSIEMLYYALRSDADQGYQRYYELAEEAFSGHFPELDAQIHTEFTQWWSVSQFREMAVRAGITEDLVQADLALRWVQRKFNAEEGGQQETIYLIDRMLKEKSFKFDELARLRLDLYRQTARGLSQPNTREMAEIRSAFQDAIKKLSVMFARVKEKKSLRAILIEDALAFAYYEFGFFEKGFGNFDDAIEHYGQSAWYYRDLNFEANQARSLNDRAYALAQIGDLDNAELQVKDALNLRQRLGLGYLIALSLNTRGIVAMLSGRSVTARENCLRALQIFRRLGYRYGQILALRAYTEALRREAQRAPKSISYMQQFLDAAREHSQACVELAQQMLSAKSELLSEVLDESACAYRDQVVFCARYKDHCAPAANEEAFNKALQLYQEALDAVPPGDGFIYHTVDTKINIAYLYYHAERPTEARNWIAQALKHVPSYIRDPKHPQHTQEIKHHTVYLGYLSKAHSLLMSIFGDDVARRDANKQTGGERRNLLNAMLKEAILTLYFADVHGGGLNRVRTAKGVVYDQLKKLSSADLKYLYDNANEASEHAQMPKKYQIYMRHYLKDQFGVPKLISQPK